MSVSPDVRLISRLFSIVHSRSINTISLLLRSVFNSVLSTPVFILTVVFFPFKQQSDQEFRRNICFSAQKLDCDRELQDQL